MKIKDLAEGLAWWGNQVGQVFAHRNLFASFPTRRFLPLQTACVAETGALEPGR
jgi:hypothetical protein